MTKKWEVESEGLLDFLTTISYLQAIFALPFKANRTDANLDKENLIRQNWQKINSILSIWGIEFFQNDFSEILALMKSKNQIDIFIAARGEERFHQINKKLDIDWDYNSLEDE